MATDRAKLPEFQDGAVDVSAKSEEGPGQNEIADAPVAEIEAGAGALSKMPR